MKLSWEDHGAVALLIASGDFSADATDNFRRVAILGPADEGINDSAARKRDSFRTEWERLGGRVVAQNSYFEDYTDRLSNMLLLNESGERQRGLSQLLGSCTGRPGGRA